MVLDFNFLYNRVYMKSAKLEWALDALSEALTLVQEGLTKFQDSDKLWMMKGQLQVGGMEPD